MRQTIEQTGFAPPPVRPLGRETRSVPLPELLAMIGLMLGTVIVATVVTAGMARG